MWLWLCGKASGLGERESEFNSLWLPRWCFNFVAFREPIAAISIKKACFTCGSKKYWYISSNLVHSAWSESFSVSFHRNKRKVEVGASAKIASFFVDNSIFTPEFFCRVDPFWHLGIFATINSSCLETQPSFYQDPSPLKWVCIKSLISFECTINYAYIPDLIRDFFVSRTLSFSGSETIIRL